MKTDLFPVDIFIRCKRLSKNAPNSTGAPHHPPDPAKFKPAVFYGSLLIIALLIGFSVFLSTSTSQLFSVLQSGISDNLGWLLVLIVNLLLVTCGYLAFTKLGNVRLGGKDAKPEFNRLTWFSMLFGAGMGIGLFVLRGG